MNYRQSINGFFQEHAPHHISADQSQVEGFFNVYKRDAFSCHLHMPSHLREFYKISLIDGKGRLIYLDKEIQIDQPTLFFSNPFIPYAWKAGNPRQGGYFCIFTEAFLQDSGRPQSLLTSPLYKKDEHPFFFLSKEEKDTMMHIFKKMMHECQGNYANKADLLRSYLYILTHEALRLQPEKDYRLVQSNSSQRIYHLLIEKLDQQFPRRVPGEAPFMTRPSDFADHLSVHVNHLNRVVKEISGKTTSQFIQQRFLQEARPLLLHTSWSISEVAYALGFSDASYFSYCFKRQYQQSPLDFRNRNV
jgi:AraC-like DNA-binding protein